MNDNTPVNRRRFLGAGLGLVSAGAAAGWALNRRGPAARKAERPALGGSFTYDVSAFSKTDPSLILYDEAAPIPTGFDSPRCIEMAQGDVLFLAGDRAVKAIGPRVSISVGVPAPRRATAARPAHCRRCDGR